MTVLYRVPDVTCGFCPKDAVRRAAGVLAQCRFENNTYGLILPFYAPGGHYGEQYWSLDYALAVEGAKWLRFGDAEDLIRNLASVQKPDGRIPLYGCEDFSAFPNVREEIGSLPKFFESVYTAAGMTHDRSLMKTAYTVLRKNLDWWFCRRQDPETKLISAVFEETFIPNTVSGSLVYAPMDTNMEIWLGCRNTADLAERLGDADEAARLRAKAQEIAEAVYRFCWDEENGAYYPYVLSAGHTWPALMASTFLGFYLPDHGRHARLMAKLKDPSLFGWGTLPLTSVAKTDPLFTVTDGLYAGNPSWQGSVWTLINDAVIRALRFAGYDTEATELALKTVEIFTDRYTEFLDPETGSGEGEQAYAWTASQFLRILLEDLCGLRYTPQDGAVLKPAVDTEFTLSGLALPDGSVVDLKHRA